MVGGDSGMETGDDQVGGLTCVVATAGTRVAGAEGYNYITIIGRI